MTNEEILKKHIPEHQIWGNGITGKSFLQYTPLENVLSALEEAREDERNLGFKNACELLDSMFSKCSTHEYMLGDCLLKKVNLLEGEPRINQGRGEGPVWVKEDFIKKLQDEIDQLKAKNRADHENGDYDIYNWENAGRYGGFQDVIKWLKEPDKLEQSKKEQ